MKIVRTILCVGALAAASLSLAGCEKPNHPVNVYGQAAPAATVS